MDEERKICPILQRGDGYCKGEKCALWVEHERMQEPMCAFAVSAISLVDLNTSGIEVYTG